MLTATSQVDDLLAQYEIYMRVERRYAENTTAGYLRDLRRCTGALQEDLGRPLAIEDLTQERLQGYLRGRTDLSPRTVQHYGMALKSLAHYAAEVIRIGGDFAAGLILPRIPPRRLPKILDRKDAEALITAPLRLTDPSVRHVGHYRDAAFLELLYGSGLRVSEACSIDLDQVKIKPDPQGGEYLAIRVIGKRKKERLVVVKGPATEVLKEYMRHRDYIPGARDNPALFLNWFGERLGRGGVRIMVKKWARRALGHERAHPHLFRHTYATDLVAALGEKLRGAQELLGHDDPVTTAQYAQIDELRLLETARKHPRAQELSYAQLLHRTGEVLRAGAALACDAGRLLWRSIKRRI